MTNCSHSACWIEKNFQARESDRLKKNRRQGLFKYAKKQASETKKASKGEGEKNKVKGGGGGVTYSPRARGPIDDCSSGSTREVRVDTSFLLSRDAIEWALFSDPRSRRGEIF